MSQDQPTSTPATPVVANPFAGRPRANLWAGVAWSLVWLGIFDAGGLTFGPQRFFASPTYAAVRTFPGIRLLGVILFALVIALVSTLSRGNAKHVGWVLVCGFVYYLYWIFAILAAWLSVGIQGWTALSKPGLFAAAYFLLVTRIDERRAR